MSLPHVEYNRAGASDSQPQIANRRRSAAEETSRISNRKWVVEATSEAQHDYNKLRAAHEKRLQQQHLQLPSTPGSRSARGRGRPSRSISPSASSTIATSSHRRSVSSAVGAGAGAGTPQHGEAQIRGRRDGPLVLDTRFHANVMRKLGLVCEFHKQAKSKVGRKTTEVDTDP